MARFWEFAHLTDNLRSLSHFDRIPQASKLYIGGLGAFYQEPDPLTKAGITHILSVTDFKVQDDRQLKKYKHLHLQVEDTAGENLLKHFQRTNDFIETALDGGGAVFVHCAMGISRSATIVTAYLMHKYQLSAEDALSRLREGRPRCRPNEGFTRQLEVYGKMLQAKAPAEADEICAKWRGNEPGVKGPSPKL